MKFVKEVCVHVDRLIHKLMGCTNPVCKSVVYNNEALISVGLFGFFISINNKDVVVTTVNTSQVNTSQVNNENMFELANVEIFNLVANFMFNRSFNR